MFAIVSSLSGLRAASPAKLAVTEVLQTLVARGEASNIDSAADLLIRWVAGQLARQGDKPRGLVIDLLGRVVAGQVPAAVDQILSAVGFQSLLAQLVDLQDEWLGGDEAPFLFRVSDGLPVLVRLKDLAGTTPVRFAFAADAGQTLGSADGLKLAIKAEASATFEIQVPTLDSLSERFGLDTFGPARSAVAIIAKGELGAGADWSLGPAAFSASANFSRGLTAVYDFPAEHSSVRALTAVVEGLPNGLSPGAIHRAIAVPGEDGLKLIQIDRARGFTFSLGYEKGVSLVDVRTVSVDGKESPITLSAAATFKLGVSHQEGQQRQLRIARRAAGGLKLSSTQVDSAETGVDVGFEAGFTITGWGDIAKALVEAHLPEAEDLLAKLGPAATPGQWLRDTLKQAIGKLPEDLAPLVGLITGELDPEQAQAALTTRIQDLLDSKVSLWTSVLQDRLEELVRSSVEQLTPSASLMSFRPALMEALTNAFDEASLLDKARRALLSQIPKGKAQLADLTQLLAKVGDRVNAAATKADQLVEPILKFLKDYDAFRQKLIAGADKIAKLRFGIAIDYARKDVATDTLETGFVIPEGVLETAAARSDFKAWVTGGRFGDPALPFGVPQANDAWKVVSTRTSESTTAIRLDLALADATTVDLLKSDTRIEVGPGGVLVALTRASAKKLAKNSWSDEVVTATGATILDALSPHLPMSALSIDLEFEDQKLEERELVSILASLARVGAAGLPTSVSDRIWNDWETVRRNQGAKAPKANLRIGLVIDNPRRERLLELARNKDKRRAALANALLHATVERPERDAVKALAVLGYDGDPAAVLVRDWDRYVAWLRFKGANKVGHIIAAENLPGAASVNNPVGRAVKAIWGAFDVVNAIDRLLATAIQWPDASDRHTKLMQTLLKTKPGLQNYEVAFLASKQLADEYSRNGRDVARALGRALSAADAMFDRNDGAPVNSLILLSFLSSVSGAELVGEVVDAA